MSRHNQLLHRTMLGGACLAALLNAEVIAAQSGEAATVPGKATVRVTVRAAGGAALGGAQVRQGPTLAAESDLAGLAVLAAVPAGPTWVRVRRIGYRPDSLLVEVPAAASLDTAIALERIAVELTAIAVIGRRDIQGPMAGFYRRQETGPGRFITYADIERRNPHNLTDLLRSVPGFNVQPRGFRNSVRVRGAFCNPLVWLDGQGLFAGEVDLDSFDPRTFEGIELYSGGSTVPVEFQGNQRASSSCGTIVLWSRRGEVRGPRQKKGAPTAASQIARLIEEAKVFAAADVDQVALMDSSTIVRPVYPDSLFAAHVPGRVLAEFVVGPDGRVDAETFNVVTTTHRLFVEPVRVALRQQRYSPALRGGRPVQQVVHQPFTFVPDSTARRRR